MLQDTFKNRKVLITAGPTRESIDPVRYISNHSTGKMGYAIAEELSNRGANVVLVSGPVHIATTLPAENIVNVTTADEMLAACRVHFETLEIAIFCAAVADFKPDVTAEHKIKKSGSEMVLKLVPNPDIALEFSTLKKDHQISVGFALETDNVLEHAKSKLLKKKLNFIVVNSPSVSGTGFGHDTNKVEIIDENGSQLSFELKSKKAVARDLADHLQHSYMAAIER